MFQFCVCVRSGASEKVNRFQKVSMRLHDSAKFASLTWKCRQCWQLCMRWCGYTHISCYKCFYKAINGFLILIYSSMVSRTIDESRELEIKTENDKTEFFTRTKVIIAYEKSSLWSWLTETCIISHRHLHRISSTENFKPETINFLLLKHINK